MHRPTVQPPDAGWLDRARARIQQALEPPEQKRFSLLYRGRNCRVFRTFEDGAKEVSIQFEDGHTAVVSRAEVMSPDGNYPFKGPDV
jgi:hypothetical protein